MCVWIIVYVWYEWTVRTGDDVRVGNVVKKGEAHFLCATAFKFRDNVNDSIGLGHSSSLARDPTRLVERALYDFSENWLLAPQGERARFFVFEFLLRYP